MVIKRVELASSNRSKCGGCKKPIPKNTPRLVCEDHYHSNYFLCPDCGKKLIHSEITDLQAMFNKLSGR